MIWEHMITLKKIATGQADDYSTGCLLDYPYSKNDNNRWSAIDLTKQQALDADPKALQQITFTGNLDWETTTFLIIED